MAMIREAGERELAGADDALSQVGAFVFLMEQLREQGKLGQRKEAIATNRNEQKLVVLCRKQVRRTQLEAFSEDLRRLTRPMEPHKGRNGELIS